MAPARGRPWLRAVGYAAVFAVAFTGFLWLQFPYPELARYAEASLARVGVTAQIRGLGPGPFPGLAATAVRLATATLPDSPVELSDVRVRVAVGSLLGGAPRLSLSARFLGGRVEAEAPVRPTGPVRARWDGLDLGRLPLPPRYREVGLAGRCGGELDLDAVPEDPTAVDGRLTARFRQVKVGPGKAAGFPVPEIDLGDGTVRLEAKKGKVAVREAVLQGGDLGLSFTNGSLLLRKPLARSLVNGSLTLSPGEKAAKELGLLFAVFPGGKGSDGRYTARVRGSLAAPRLLRR